MYRIASLAMTVALVCGVSQANQRQSDNTIAMTSANLDGVEVDSLSMTRNGRYLTVEMLLNLSSLKVDGNRAVLITPRIVNGNDSIDLTAVGIYGRRRYYTYVRNGESMLSGGDELSFRESKKPDSIRYHANVDYNDWMNGAKLSIERDEYGCCNSLLNEQYALLDGYEELNTEFFPELVYVHPKAERTKSRTLEGSAYIDFPVNRTEINPDYRRNTAELGKIQASIDSVRGDRDVTITQVWLKGFASPESPYSHNRDLAIGRTNSLKNYIQQLYKFGDGIIATDFEPEDWEGLRRFVEQSNINHKAEIIAMIDSDRDPDNKELAIKKNYPEEYRFMLQNFYPALRHTDYRIAYTIRDFNDVEEIKQMLASKPNKLSLDEFYLVAQEYEPGSDEFSDVFDTAVRMFPNDTIANLNAANAAIRRDDFAAAARYLAKAGDTAEADYARGALAIRRGDIDNARTWLNKAKDKGLLQAARTLQELDARQQK